MTKPSDLYLTAVLEAVPRMLNLLDRNPSSKTYGSFDRDFWLHRTKDFSASSAQMSVHTLALLYSTPYEGNAFYKETNVLAWINASLSFTLTLQHEDGSFDEWYPNERGWAGPTGYVAHALYQTWQLLGNELPLHLQKQLRLAMLKAARHLALRDEGDILANHYAIALLPMTEIARAFSDSALLKDCEKWNRKFKALMTPEGWCLEYDGCDIGYALGTLDFISDLHALTGDEDLLTFAQKSFSFLNHFAYPDGSWAGSLGSRHTSHRYPFALEYWSSLIKEARPLLQHYRKALVAGKDLLPRDQEDHYIHYRMQSYFKAADFTKNEDLSIYFLPYEDKNFSRVRFELSGFHIEKRGSIVLWMSFRRGGALRIYNLATGKALLIDNGCQVVQEDGKTLTSLWQSARFKSKVDLSLEAPLYFIFMKRFTPSKLILFRIATFFMASARWAYFFKKFIRKLLITNKNSSSSRWSRQVKWDNGQIVINDQIQWQQSSRWQAIYYGGEFHTRFVPQGQYFSEAEMDFFPRQFTQGEFKNPSQPQFTTSLDTDTGNLTICAQ